MSSVNRSPDFTNLYVTVSSMAIALLLLWPVAFPAPIGASWLIAASTVLFVIILMDSLLDTEHELENPISTAVWIMGGAFMLLLVFRDKGNLYFAALLFALHAGKSAMLIWHNSHGWWLWSAWIRDTLIASGLFLWLILYA